MARSKGGDEPLGEEDYELMRERLDEHFEKMQEMMEQELEDSARE